MSTHEIPELIFRSCVCGNTNPDAYSFRAVGYRDWSEANGVPMVPIFYLGSCDKCNRRIPVRVAE